METHHHVDVLILAGGEGSRIKSHFPTIPKPLIPVHHIPILIRILKAIQDLVDLIQHDRLPVTIQQVSIVVPQPKEKEFQKVLTTWIHHLHYEFTFTWNTIPQDEYGKGTGYAVQTAVEAIPSSVQAPYLLIVNGDQPFLSPTVLKEMLMCSLPSSSHDDTELVQMVALRQHTLDTSVTENMGRLEIDEEMQLCTGIQEAYEDTRQVSSTLGLYNTGMYILSTAFVRRVVFQLPPCPLSHEIRFTDIVKRANQGRGCTWIEFSPQYALTFLNVNTYYDWMMAEHMAQTE